MAQAMLRSDSWADSLTIHLIGNYFRIKFLIYDDRRNKFICQGYVKDDYTILAILYYKDTVHYRVGIVFKDNKRILPSSFRKDISDEGMEFLNILFNDKNKSFGCIT